MPPLPTPTSQKLKPKRQQYSSAKTAYLARSALHTHLSSHLTTHPRIRLQTEIGIVVFFLSRFCFDFRGFPFYLATKSSCYSYCLSIYYHPETSAGRSTKTHGYSLTFPDYWSGWLRSELTWSICPGFESQFERHLGLCFYRYHYSDHWQAYPP